MAVLGISTSVFFSGCKKDPCKDVVCQNSGVPTESTDGETCACECTAGYEGEFCETESRAKFIGTYTASDACSTSGSSTYTTTISTSSASADKVLLSNFWGVFTNPVTATVAGSTITIASQDPDNDGYKVSGNGTISGSTITFTYSITDPAGTVDNCNSTWTKQ